MFRPAKATDVKFFKYSLHTPYLMSPLDGGIEQCTRTSGQNSMFGKTHDPHQRNLMPSPLDDFEPEKEDMQ